MGQLKTGVSFYCELGGFPWLNVWNLKNSTDNEICKPSTLKSSTEVLWLYEHRSVGLQLDDLIAINWSLITRQDLWYVPFPAAFWWPAVGCTAFVSLGRIWLLGARMRDSNGGPLKAVCGDQWVLFTAWLCTDTSNWFLPSPKNIRVLRRTTDFPTKVSACAKVTGDTGCNKSWRKYFLGLLDLPNLD